MRRFILLFASLLLIFTAIATAQKQDQEPTLKIVEPTDPIPMPDDFVWEPMVQGLYVPVELEPVSSPRGLRTANDTCGAAGSLPTFNISADGTTYFSGDLTVVNGFTVDSLDPLVCSSTVAPANQRGYRTAWYRFVAPATGELTVTTLPNFSHREDYDTIVSILTGNSCDVAAVVACNDDANGFLSEVSVHVSQGSTYFIHVADFNLEVSGEAKLNVSVRIDSADFSANEPAWYENTLADNRSRHVSKVIDDKIYVFSGQTTVDATSPVRTAETDVFDPATGTWESKPSMIGSCSPRGYSNVDASYYVNEDSETGETLRRVFFPSGYVGDSQSASDVNCVYNVDTEVWSIGTGAPFVDDVAPIYTSVHNFANGFVVVGGITDNFDDPKESEPRSNVYTYFVDNDLWLTNTPFPPLPSGRYAHTGVTLRDQFICVTGGLDYGVAGNGSRFYTLLTDSLCLSINLPGNGWQPIAGLNIPRFNASSAIGADGSWIVYGGVTLNGSAVSEIEMYDFDAGVWVVLDDRFAITDPPRIWANGGVVDGDLWVIGGEADISIPFGTFITPLVERITNLPRLNAPSGNDQFLPFMAQDKLLRRDLRTQAIPIGVGQLVQNNFNAPGARFHLYSFNVTESADYRITLTNIPSGDNYDMFLYLSSKTELNTSENIGNANEEIGGVLGPGQYYLLVAVEEDATPADTGNYRLLLEQR